MCGSFLWGIVAGSSLVLGGILASSSVGRRTLGLIMAFGAGVLISAVAFEFVHEAFETSAGDRRHERDRRPRHRLPLSALESVST